MGVDIAVGGFGLRRIIASGGMADVWEARRLAGRASVAVKVITTDYASDPGFLEDFHREVQTTAMLRHSGIAVVLDCGVIEPASAAQSEGQLVAGSPYMVMELADGSLPNTVHDAAFGWNELEHLLLSLLDALAHAHARGVIHRDLKPDNVLTFGPPAARTFKLSDFGIAHSMFTSRPGSEDLIIGTVEYMAPEQLLGQWRDYGPSTDLYALGCLTYELVGGRLPFDGASIGEIAYKQLYEDPPPLRPVFPVPEGFEGWVRRLMEKDWLDRYLHAADARAALRSLGPVDDRAAVAVSGSFGRRTEPVCVQRTTVLGAPSPSSKRLAPSMRGRLEDDPLPPVPVDWRFDEPPVVATAPSASLYPLRSIPLVGRERERDQLWSALRTTIADGRARCVIIEGPSGSGKSRLAEWLCLRSDEVGAAATMKATHSLNGARSDGLPNMLARYMHCAGLGSAEIDARVDHLVRLYGVTEKWGIAMLRRLMREVSEDAAPSQASQNPDARAAAMLQLINRVSRWRPLVVWIDDLQWGDEAIHFLKTVLQGDERPKLRALFVATVQREALAERPEAAESIEALAGCDGCETIALDKLSQHDTAELLSELLQLDPATMRRITGKVDGNPLFAVQLVGDWIARGDLELDGDVFRLREGVQLSIPDDLHNVWAGRLERAMVGRPQHDTRALELAATLGVDVDRSEWLGLCDLAGVTAEADVVAWLVAQGLAVYRERGWAFAHAMLRESLLRLMREHGTINKAQRLAADFLVSVHRSHARLGLLERIGRHAFDSGSLHEALAPLLAGAREREVMGDYRRALELMDLRDRAIRELGPGHEREGVIGTLSRTRLLGRLGAWDDAADVVDRARRVADAYGWADLVGEALAERSDIDSHRGRLRDALALARDALAIFEPLGHEPGIALAELRIADAASYMGQHEAALASYRRALDLQVRLGDDFGVASACWGLGYVLLQMQQYDAADEYLERAHSGFVGRGADSYAFRVLTSIADLQRMRGDLEGARTKYEQALNFFDAIGDAKNVANDLNLIIVACQQGDFARAEGLLARTYDKLVRSSVEYLFATYHALALICAAAAGRWSEWDMHDTELRRWLERTGALELDDVLLVKRAAELARDGGERARAADLFMLSATLWRRFAREPEAADAERCALELRDQ